MKYGDIYGNLPGLVEYWVVGRRDSVSIIEKHQLNALGWRQN